MKRSQAIRVICMELGNFDKILANNILKSLEEAGMLPPQREVVVTDQCDIRKLRYIDYDNSWEPENEA